MTDKQVIIYADNRENNKVTDILKHRCDLRQKQLAVADYLLSKRVAVERKTCEDFLSSMVDGRLFKQLGELKENFRTPVLIIEGNELFDSDRKIHPNAIRGAIASVATDYCLPIIWTKTPLETAEMLISIATREQITRNKSIALRGKKKAKSMNHRQEFLVAGLPQISTQTARKLLKHFGSPEKIFAATKEELMEVEGVGPKNAKRIRLVLAKKYEKSVLED
ncbi:MAG: ERCC4 domain-containing protein [Candidatus Aenigmatarchaeota archaeon]